jgi:hypothetical protein
MTVIIQQSASALTLTARTDTPAETHNRRRDKPAQSEATPICTPSIREFVVFIRERFSPTDAPDETHNPPQGQPPPAQSGLPFHLSEASMTH